MSLARSNMGCYCHVSYSLADLPHHWLYSTPKYGFCILKGNNIFLYRPFLESNRLQGHCASVETLRLCLRLISTHICLPCLNKCHCSRVRCNSLVFPGVTITESTIVLLDKLKASQRLSINPALNTTHLNVKMDDEDLEQFLYEESLIHRDSMGNKPFSIYLPASFPFQIIQGLGHNE